MNVLGIDPGKGGGICFISTQGVVHVGKMVEGKALFQYLTETRDQFGPMICYLERVSSWRGELNDAPGKRFGLDKMLANFNRIKNTLELADIPYIIVSSITWQGYLKKTGVSTRGFKNKKNAWKGFAIEKFPRKLKQINLATADAICIAWYGKQALGSNSIQERKKIQNPESLTLL